MRIFLATNSTRIHVGLMRRLKPPNMLISYHYFKDIMIFADYTSDWYPKRLMIDSGAFSVWTKQGSIDIDNYINYCKNVKSEAGDKTELIFVNLDVLPGHYGVYPSKDQREESAEKGWANMEYMENAGIKVIHVFHQHEDFKWLKKLMAHQEYIGISPANDEVQSSKNNWLKKVFTMVKTSNKCHGFAVTSLNTLLKFPFYSADSSSWVVGAKYARIPVFKNGKFSSLQFKDKATASKMFELTEAKSMENYTNYHTRMEEGIRAYMKMEQFITKVWEGRGITWA